MPITLDAMMIDAFTAQISPPAIIRPFVDINPGASAAIAQEQAELFREHEGKFEAWSLSAAASMDRLVAQVEAEELEPHHLDLMLKCAEMMELQAEASAKDHMQADKRLQRMLKQMRAIDRKAADEYAKGWDAAVALYQREIDVRLEAALVFRALRAKKAKSNRTGHSANSPSSVRQMFKAALAS